MASTRADNPASVDRLESVLPGAGGKRSPTSLLAHAISRGLALEHVSPHRDLSGHIPALDGVRGLAILMVLLFHFVGNTLPTSPVERVIVSATNYGSYGVELFFILS